MLNILAFFATNRIGRWIAGVAVSLFAVFTLLASVFRAGKKSAQAEQDKASLDNMRTRERIEDETAKTSVADKRSRLRDWVSNDK